MPWYIVETVTAGTRRHWRVFTDAAPVVRVCNPDDGVILIPQPDPLCPDCHTPLTTAADETLPANYCTTCDREV